MKKKVLLKELKRQLKEIKDYLPLDVVTENISFEPKSIEKLLTGNVVQLDKKTVKLNFYDQNTFCSVAGDLEYKEFDKKQLRNLLLYLLLYRQRRYKLEEKIL